MTLLVILFLTQPSPIPGSSHTYTDGIHTWAGNPFCADANLLLTPGSAAIDAAALVPGLHCDTPGPTPTGCVEWYGAAPDIGACEFVPLSLALTPSNFAVISP